MNILVINGPNLNLLGIREPDIYGKKSYCDLVDYLKTLAEKYNIKLDVFQSNHEGAIIDKIQAAYFNKTAGIVINPGAYGHYSYAIRDALAAVKIKTVEVHLSDISRRETFRHKSVITDLSVATFSGEGFAGYEKAIKIILGDEK